MQIVSSGANEAFLFVVVDRRCAVAEIRPRAIAHLDEDGFTFIRHHEVDFADARAVVARNRTKSTLREESLSGAFRAAPQLRARRRLKVPR
jgi:hypothetical protein